MDISKGYKVMPAENGGWIIEGKPESFGDNPALIGAFSNYEDMLEALEKAHMPKSLNQMQGNQYLGNVLTGAS